MQSRLIVLSASSYSIDGDNGKKIEGVTVWAVPTDRLDPTDDGKGHLGVAPFKANLPIEMRSSFTFVPGVYVCDLEMSTSQGKLSLGIKTADFFEYVPKYIATHPNK